MLEYEHKVILTPEEYRCISEHLAGNAPSSVQTNYYYDTDDMKMNSQKTTCRIREKNGIYTAVIKKHLPAIGLSEKTVIYTGKLKDASSFERMGLKSQGSLRTERTVLYSDDYIKAIIDMNIYLGCTDYELEVEYKPGCEEPAAVYMQHVYELCLHNLWGQSTVTFFERARSAKSKSERFFERKEYLIEKLNYKYIQVTGRPE